MDKWWLNQPEDGMATPEALDEWLGRDTISLWDAALIANGAYPGTDAGRISRDCCIAVFETEQLLSRSTGPEVANTASDQILFLIATVFEALERANHEFPTSVKAALRDRGFISKRDSSWQGLHKNTEID